MALSGIQMPNADVVDFSRNTSHLSGRSFAMAVPLHVTFTMEDTMFEQHFPCIPDYGELWRTLRDKLHLDDTSAVLSFKVYMDDVLLTNRNTVETLREALNSCSHASRASIILAVIKSADLEPVNKGAVFPDDRQKGSYRWVRPHALYLLVVALLVGGSGLYFSDLHGRLSGQEEQLQSALGTIDRLTGRLEGEAEDRAGRDAAARELRDDLEQLRRRFTADLQTCRAAHAGTREELGEALEALHARHPDLPPGGRLLGGALESLARARGDLSSCREELARLEKAGPPYFVD